MPGEKGDVTDEPWWYCDRGRGAGLVEWFWVCSGTISGGASQPRKRGYAKVKIQLKREGSSDGQSPVKKSTEEPA